MLGHYLHQHIESFPIFARLVTGLLLTAAVSAPAEAYDLCPESAPLALNTTLRSPGSVGASRACYRLVIPAPGILTLNASAPGSPEAETRLDFLGADYLGVPVPQGQAGGHYRLIEQRPRGVIVKVESPGTFFVAVAPEDPARPPAGYKLRSAFLGTGTATAARVVFCEPLLSEGPGGAVSSTPGPLDASTSLAAKSVDEEECEVLELSSGPAHPALRLLASCGLGEVDDHGDTALCATPLTVLLPHDPSRGVVAGSATGTIGNAADDDEDFFSFELDRQRTLTIEVLEAAAGHVTLYDDQGLRLGAGGAGAPATHLVRTLPPGRYYLRVLSMLGSGELYVLSLADLHEP